MGVNKIVRIEFLIAAISFNGTTSPKFGCGLKRKSKSVYGFTRAITLAVTPTLFGFASDRISVLIVLFIPYPPQFTLPDPAVIDPASAESPTLPKGFPSTLTVPDPAFKKATWGAQGGLGGNG